MSVSRILFNFIPNQILGGPLGSAGLNSSGESAVPKTPQELEEEANRILQENGYTRKGTARKQGQDAKEAFLQSRFEGRMWNSGFRGASRKNA